jgi:hypothetical protein
MDFDAKEQASFVKDHGGQLLSLKFVEALKSDSRRDVNKNGGGSATRRKCYVVCWGGYSDIHSTGTSNLLDINPLTSQIKRHNLCDLICVTPLWIQTCVTVQKRVRPESVPTILVPQPWPMRKSLQLTTGMENDTTAPPDRRRLDVSLTGFQGTEKVAIIHLIGAMGGLYHDHMSRSSTHLVCKEKATGLKLEKAIEWGLQIVSVRWLYHILQHGYHGTTNTENKDDDDYDGIIMRGCEDEFSLVKG